MPDQRSLRVIGFVYGGVTAVVMLIACVIVSYHVAGRLSIDAAASPSIEVAKAH